MNCKRHQGGTGHPSRLGVDLKIGARICFKVPEMPLKTPRLKHCQR
jgi:hypothetical protein